jgi:queuosine precursor transporter
MYEFINSIFCIIVVISNIISIKMVKLPFFEDFSIPTGLIMYPLTFFLSDFITEIYGAKKAQKMVWHAFGMSILSYLIIKIALILPSSNVEGQLYFEKVFGLNGLILLASLTAYVFSQTIDVWFYSLIKKRTGQNYLWLRNNGSTLVAQLIDTTIVNMIHLKVGVGMEMYQILPIMLFSYAYKCTFSLVFTPLFYLLVFVFKKRIVTSG